MQKKLFYGGPLIFKTSLLIHFPSKTMRKVQVVSNKNEKVVPKREITSAQF
jgi:hypothetical protein